MTIQTVFSSRISVNSTTIRPHIAQHHNPRISCSTPPSSCHFLLLLPCSQTLSVQVLPTLRTPLTEITKLTSFCTAVTHTSFTCHRLPFAAPSCTKAEDSSRIAGLVLLDVSYEPNYTVSYLKILNNDDMATRTPVLKLLAEQGHFV